MGRNYKLAKKLKPVEADRAIKGPKGEWLPSGKKHFQDWNPVEYPGPYKALILSDVHVPYHESDVLKVAVTAGQKAGCNMVLLMGDIMDCYACSRWQKNPKERDFAAEVSAGRQFLKWIRSKFPKARIVYKEGNHEERWRDLLWEKVPELSQIDDFEFQSLFRLKDSGIEWTGEMRPLALGKLFAIHGHEYRWAIANPVNPARGVFLRGIMSVICGHHHTTSSHSAKRLDGQVIATHSIGCLCDTHYGYGPINNHNHGFAIVDVAKDGTYTVYNPRVIDGEERP